MPNPLSNVTPNAKPNFEPDAAIKRPRLAANAFRAISEWSSVDAELGHLLVTFLKSDYRVGLEIYETFTSWGAKRQAVTAAARHALSDDAFAIFDAILNRFKATRNRRNSLAHDIWGYADELPDALLSVEAKHTHRYWSEFKDAGAAPVVLHPMNHDLIFVWTRADMEQLLGEIWEAGELLNLFNLNCLIKPEGREQGLARLAARLGIEPKARSQPPPQSPPPQPQSPQEAPSG
jgi:hypothetical protein